MTHDEGCEGAHLDVISCAKVKKIRAAARANVWICRYGRNGYHSFQTDDVDEVCNNDGCERTRGELNAAYRRRPDRG
jgi:hypothetical protein